jgi:hypothetical protein
MGHRRLVEMYYQERNGQAISKAYKTLQTWRLEKEAENIRKGTPKKELGDVSQRYDFFRDITPNFKSALPINARQRLQENTKRAADSLGDPAKTKSAELWCHAYLTVLTPVFGVYMPRQMQKYQDYINRKEGKKCIFTSNVSETQKDNTWEDEHSKTGKFGVIDMTLHEDKRLTYDDKYEAIMADSPLGKVANLDDAVTEILDTYFKWLDHPPNFAKFSGWITYMAAMNLASVLPPALAMQPRRELGQPKIINHPLGKDFKKNYTWI